MARHGDALYQRGETWYLGCSINGTRYQKRIGKGITRTVARKMADVLRGKILTGDLGIGKKLKDLSFDEASKRFEDWATTNKKPGTTRHYQECLRQLATSFSGKRLSQVSPFAVEAYKQIRFKQAKVCVNRELAVLKSLFNRCKEWKLFAGENPVVSVKLVKESRGRDRFLEHEEEDRLLAACAEPLRTMILIGTNCGLRLKSEALTLQWRDVDLVRKTLTVQAAYNKNGQTRSVSLNSVVLAALNRLPKHGDFVFAKSDGTPYSAIRGFAKARQAAGLVDLVPNTKRFAVTVHTTRHTFGSRLVETGVDLRMVQELGGWKTLAMVLRYAHVSPGRKAEAVEGLVRHSTTGSTTAEIRRIGHIA
jgi:integrase